MKTGPTYAFAAALALASYGMTAAPAGAQSLDAVDAAFKEWMGKHKVRSGVLAVAYQRRLVLSRGYGGTNANGPVLLASLSKAITAVCAATLVDAGKLAFDTRIGDALSGYFKRHGEPSDPRIKGATIGQALAHRSGYARGSDPRNTGDPATGTTLSDYLATQRASDPSIDKLLMRAFRHPVVNEPGQRYAYTNMSYLIVGAAIEQASERRYEDYCRDAVLSPLGVDARIHPSWAVLGAFGGWQLTGPQYLRFLEAFASDSKVLGPKGKAFMADGTDKWSNDKRDVYYALGVSVRPVQGGGYNVWHAGEWRYNFTNSHNGRLVENLGTYAVRLDRGVSWFSQFEPEPPDGAKSELDRVISKVTSEINIWPAEDLYAGIDAKK
jgi:CubicO group peptidase (beta-lactamase class C family)